jgi:hypothetical protein
MVTHTAMSARAKSSEPCGASRMRADDPSRRGGEEVRR